MPTGLPEESILTLCGSAALYCAVLGMFLVKSQQDLFALVAGLCRASSSAAVTTRPCLVVKLCTLPAKPLNRTLAQDHARACGMCGLPACNSMPALRRLV